MACPSRAAEIHHVSQEMTEQCPVCGKENADPKTGNWVCEETAPFCSASCELLCITEQKKEDAAYAEALQQEEDAGPV